MRRVSVTELKNRLSHYLRLVKKGEAIEVVERGLPIAVIGRAMTPRNSSEVLERLVRAGIVTPPKEKLDVEAFLRHPPVPCSGDAVQALIDSRGDR